MIRIIKNIPRTLLLPLLMATAACSDEESHNLPSAMEGDGTIAFQGIVENNRSVETRSSDIMNEDGENYKDIYIYQQTAETFNGLETASPKIQIYNTDPGQRGELVTEEQYPLNWNSATAWHVFYAWTAPHPDGKDGSEGGVKMDDPTDEQTYSTTGTVTFGTYEDTELDRFIVAQKGPLTYESWNKYVSLHFYHPVARIELVQVTHIMPDNHAEDIGKCTITFPNLYKSARFNAIYDITANDYDEKYPDVFTYETQQQGIDWKWEKTKSEGDHRLYVHPFIFKKENLPDYEQPGYFTVTTSDGVYTGTLADILLADASNPNNLQSELKGGDWMKMSLTVEDGNVSGIYSNVENWDTKGDEPIYQHRVPGIYTQEDAEALLEGLQSDPVNIPPYLIDIDENNNTKTIRFFTHVNWESLLDEEEVESITIPQEYILDGQDYNLTLPKDVNLYGVKGEGEDEAGNIKHLYVNGDEYTVVEEPDPDTEPDEGTGEDGTGGTGNPDAGTTPGTPGTEDPTTGDNTANT